MNDPEAAWGEDGADGQAVREPAVGFPWADVGGMADHDVRELVEQARRDGASEMLSMLVSLCAEGVTKVTQRDARARTVGLRLLCAAALLRPGQVTEQRQRDIASMIGVHQSSVCRVLQYVRGALKRMERAGDAYRQPSMDGNAQELPHEG